jgi:hypothetical protein
LDKLDGAGLADGDLAFGAAGGVFHAYILDDDSAAAESSPDIIAPDTNAGDKRWILQNVIPGGLNVMTYKGVLNCSGNPDYPAGDAGDIYFVSVAGKVGGASGTTVEVGDAIMCNTDGTTTGDEAAKGAYWDLLQGNFNLTDYVAKTTYAAYSILAADTVNTPAAVELAASQMIGRKASGGIVALSKSDIQTIVNVSDGATANTKAAGSDLDEGTDDAKHATAKALADSKYVKRDEVATLENKTIQLAENAPIILDSALSADGKYSGIIRDGIAGATLAFGDSVYLAVADSRWELTDADAAATSFGLLGICVLAAASNGDATKVLLWGIVRADTAFPSFTVGAPVYLSTTDGDLTSTAPTGSGDCVRIVGQAWTADELFFNPSPDWVELT